MIKKFKQFENKIYENISFDKETIVAKINNINAEIVSDPESDVLVVRVNDYAASNAIGSKHWDITTSQSMWKHLVNDFTNQYFIFNFTKDESDKEHLMTASISPGGKITNAYYYDDTHITDLSIFDNI